MTSRQFDITQHIDYENHMKDYIKKSDAKQIIDTLKNKVGYRPIQSHPDYPALMNMLDQKHSKDMSKLEQEMRRKTQSPGSINDITMHPEYKTLVKKYEEQIVALTRKLSLVQSRRPLECPPVQKCVKCEKCVTVPKCPTCPKCTNQIDSDYTMKANLISGEPVAANNYPPMEVPIAPSWGTWRIK
jgi:hypothetical protein